MTDLSPDFRTGPPAYYVPVVKHPRDYQITQGPLGYERYEDEAEARKACPICVKPQTGGI